MGNKILLVIIPLIFSLGIVPALPFSQADSHFTQICIDKVWIESTKGRIACVTPTTAEKLVERGWGTLLEELPAEKPMEELLEVRSEYVGEPKVILITGTASGIGKATAEKLVERGHIVYGGDIKIEENKYLDEIGGHALIMDVTNDEQVKAGVQNVIDEQGRIDVLINNAGYGSFATIENIGIEELKQQFDVNVFGYARLQQEVLPHMREQGHGRVIVTSSVVGEISAPMLGWYAATKHAIEAMADALRQEVKHLNIDVVKIQPGAVNTNFDEVAFAKLDNSYIPEDYKDLATDFRLVMTAIFYAAEGPDNTAYYIVEAVETQNPKTTYITTEDARQALELKRSLSESEYDEALAAQFKQGADP